MPQTLPNTSITLVTLPHIIVACYHLKENSVVRYKCTLYTKWLGYNEAEVMGAWGFEKMVKCHQLTFAATIVSKTSAARGDLPEPFTVAPLEPHQAHRGRNPTEIRHVCGRRRLQRNKGSGKMEFLEDYGPRAPRGRPAPQPWMDVWHGAHDDPSSPMA